MLSRLSTIKARLRLAALGTTRGTWHVIWLLILALFFLLVSMPVPAQERGNPGGGAVNAAFFQLKTNPVAYFGSPAITALPTWAFDGVSRYQWSFFDLSPIILIRRDAAPNRVIYIGGVNAAVGPDAVSCQMTGPEEGNVDPRFTVHYGDFWGYSLNTNKITGSYGGAFGNLLIYSNDTSGNVYFGDPGTSTKIQSFLTVDIPAGIKVFNNTPIQAKDSAGNYQDILKLDGSDDLVLGGGGGVGGITTDKNISANVLIGSGGLQANLSGQIVTKIFSATATLDFASTAAQTSSDLTIGVTGAVTGDPVFISTPTASILANCTFTAWVSAANTVTVRLNNYSSSAKDPASGVFRATVFHF